MISHEHKLKGEVDKENLGSLYRGKFDKVNLKGRLSEGNLYALQSIGVFAVYL